MQNNQDFSEILTMVGTREEYQLLNEELNLLGNSIYKTGAEGFDVTLKNSVREETSRLISSLNVPDKKDLIEKLKKELSKLEFIELTIAIEPTTYFVGKISGWVKNKIGQNIAIDIKVDKEMIAGVILAFKGKYLDLSLKKDLEKILINYV